MKELTIQEALCILKCGWSTSDEEELLDIARTKIIKVARKLHLEYQADKIKEKLNKLK